MTNLGTSDNPEGLNEVNHEVLSKAKPSRTIDKSIPKNKKGAV